MTENGSVIIGSTAVQSTIPEDVVSEFKLPVTPDDGAPPRKRRKIAQDPTEKEALQREIKPYKVSEMRKGLQEMREIMSRNSPQTPVFLTTPVLDGGVTMAQFAMNSIFVQHVRRHCKSTK